MKRIGVNMFNINDEVIYGQNGVCRVVEIGKREIRGNPKTCYFLTPVHGEKVTIIFPIDSTLARNRMRRLLTRDEILNMIHAMPGEETINIENEAVRRKEYKDILMGNDRKALIRLIKTLYIRDKEKRQCGLKIRVADRCLMKDAEKILYEEIAYVVGIETGQVLPFIKSELGDL